MLIFFTHRDLEIDMNLYSSVVVNSGPGTYPANICISNIYPIWALGPGPYAGGAGGAAPRW